MEKLIKFLDKYNISITLFISILLAAMIIGHYITMAADRIGSSIFMSP